MLFISKSAEFDLNKAFLWYNIQKINLGHQFLKEIEKVFKKIQSNPKSYQIAFDKVRRSLSKKFPFSIYYTINKNDITIIAVLHQNQDYTSRLLK